MCWLNSLRAIYRNSMNNIEYTQVTDEKKTNTSMIKVKWQ